MGRRVTPTEEQSDRDSPLFSPSALVLFDKILILRFANDIWRTIFTRYQLWDEDFYFIPIVSVVFFYEFQLTIHRYKHRSVLVGLDWNVKLRFRLHLRLVCLLLILYFFTTFVLIWPVRLYTCALYLELWKICALWWCILDTSYKDYLKHIGPVDNWCVHSPTQGFDNLISSFWKCALDRSGS